MFVGIPPLRSPSRAKGITLVRGTEAPGVNTVCPGSCSRWCLRSWRGLDGSRTDDPETSSGLQAFRASSSGVELCPGSHLGHPPHISTLYLTKAPAGFSFLVSSRIHCVAGTATRIWHSFFPVGPRTSILAQHAEVDQLYAQKLAFSLQGESLGPATLEGHRLMYDHGVFLEENKNRRDVDK